MSVGSLVRIRSPLCATSTTVASIGSLVPAWASRTPAPAIPGVGELEIVPVVFAPLGAANPAVDTGMHVIDARTVFEVLR